MDHSYRQNGAAEGNQGNGAGHAGQGGRFRQPGRQQQLSHFQGPAVEPMRPREDGITRIFAFIEDLFFLAKIREVSKKLNVPVGFVKTDKELFEKVEAQGERPSLIIVDLNNNTIKPLTLIPKIKAKFKKDSSIVGFVSHIQGDLKMQAQEAGCDVVMPRSAFSQNLPNILRRHAEGEEQDEQHFNQPGL